MLAPACESFVGTGPCTSAWAALTSSLCDCSAGCDCFTGSTGVGKLLAKLAAGTLKKVSLELGGNAPLIVFDDANLDQALEQFMALKWRHAGQACITANRLYVQAGVYDKFTEMLVEKTKKLKMGHGSEEGTTLGPVCTPRGLVKAQQQAEDAVKLGAKMVLGTGKAEKNATEDEGSGQGKGVGGYFMAPTVLTGMSPDMLMAREETFAPVIGLFKFETEQEVVQWANETSMGLGKSQLPTRLINANFSQLHMHSQRTSTDYGECWRISRLV